jgi:LysR family cyn operon transcriptional activator
MVLLLMRSRNDCMNLSQLRTFVAITELGGFGRAAARLNLTQSAASRQIGALESEFGIRLFDRVGRRIKITSEGENLLRQILCVLKNVEVLGEQALALKSGEIGLLRIGATPHVIENLLADFLARHRRKHPGVEVHLVEDGGARLPNRIESGDVHLAIIPAGHDALAGRLLYPMHLLAVLPKSHRLSKAGGLEIAKLADEPIMVMGPGGASLVWLDAACHAAHVRPRLQLQSGAPHTLIKLAQSGYGIALVPSNVTIAAKGVRVMPLVHRGNSIGRWAMIAWNPERFLAPYAERFIEELIASVQSAYPGYQHVRGVPPLPRPKEELGSPA